MGCLVSLVYLAAAAALWRLWSTDHDMLWWCILAAAVLQFWTEATVRTAYRQALVGAEPRDELESLVASGEAKRSDVVRFWVKANMVLAAVTLILAVVGIAVSFGDT